MRTSAAPAREAAAPVPALRAHRVAPERAEQIPPGHALDAPGPLGRALALHPVSTGLLALLAVFVGGTLVGSVLGHALGAAVAPAEEDAYAELVGDVVRAALVLGLLVHLGWVRRVGFGGPSTWRSLGLFVVPALLTLLVLVASLGDAELSSAERAIAVLPQPLLTGFWEEGLTRGFLLFVLLAVAVRTGRGPVVAVVGSAVVFGLLHVVNLVNGDAGATLSQVLYATAIGIGFGALLLRTNALWLLVALHAVFNLGPALQADDGSSGFSVGAVVLSLPLAVYGLLLLRRRGGEQPAPAGTAG